MIWKNVEIHNAAELVETDGGVTWTRIPGKIREGMEKEGGKFMAGNSTGVELRFVMKSDEVRIRMAALALCKMVLPVIMLELHYGTDNLKLIAYVCNASAHPT